MEFLGMPFVKSLRSLPSLCLAVITAIILVPQIAAAAPLLLSDGDVVRLDRNARTFGGANGGGAFELTGVTVANGAGDPFLTFCMEFNENLSLGTNYFVAVNNRAIGGGAGAAGTYPGDVSGVSGSYDPLSPATAWLYTQFRSQTIGNHVSFNYQSNSDLNALQAAIWFLENERAVNTLDAKGVALKDAAIGANWIGTGNVKVLNLWGTRTGSPGNYQFSGLRQDQLALTTDLVVPVPEPSTIVMALAGGVVFAGVASRRRRRARAAA
jgi:hypothetical protein